MVYRLRKVKTVEKIGNLCVHAILLAEKLYFSLIFSKFAINNRLLFDVVTGVLSGH